MLVRLPHVWLQEVIVLAVAAVVLVYGIVLRAVHPGHQRVPIPAQLAITAAIVVAVGGFLVLKGRRAGIEVGPDVITIRRCWLPDRQLSRDEVRGYQRVRQQLGVAGSLQLTYIALTLTSGDHVKTLGTALMRGPSGRMSDKKELRLENAGKQLSQLGIRPDPAQRRSSLARIFRRAKLHDKVAHSDASGRN